MRVTRLDGLNPASGVKISWSPSADQWPGMDGCSVGCGVSVATGPENVTVIGPAPLIWRAPSAGVIETSLIGAGGRLDLRASADVRSAPCC